MRKRKRETEVEMTGEERRRRDDKSCENTIQACLRWQVKWQLPQAERRKILQTQKIAVDGD